MRPTIFAIVGASGSGKTYLTKYLQRELNIPYIVSRTTRPAREGEIEGEDYIFIPSAGIYPRSKMLTYTRFGGHEYFSLRSQLPKEGFCTYVVDEQGVEALKLAEGPDFDVIAISVQSSLETLKKRGIDSQRIERDRARKELGYIWVDGAIENDGTIEEFEQAILKEVMKWQRRR